MLWKCGTQYANTFGKLSSGRRTEKGQFSFQSQRKAMQRMLKLPHNCTISHASKVMFKILQARLHQYMNSELLDVQAGFRKGRGTRDQITNILWIMEKSKRVPEKHLFLLYWLCHSLWLCGSQWTVENSQRDGNTRPPDLPLEISVCSSGSNN